MMDFAREQWVRLYVRESLDHRRWPVAWRGLRDLLLRFAGEDGTLLGATEAPGLDLAAALGARLEEVELVELATAAMIVDGYLTHDGRLWITHYSEAQQHRTSTERVRRWRKKQRATNADETHETLRNTVAQPRARASGREREKDREREREREAPRAGARGGGRGGMRAEARGCAREARDDTHHTSDSDQDRIAAAIEAWPQLAPLHSTSAQLAATLLGRTMARGITTAQAIEAIADAAADTPGGEKVQAVLRRVRGYVDHGRESARRRAAERQTEGGRASAAEHREREAAERREYERREREAVPASEAPKHIAGVLSAIVGVGHAAGAKKPVTAGSVRKQGS